MPRTVARQKPYDVVFVGDQKNEKQLTTAQIDAVSRILPRPSREFISAYSFTLGNYVAYRAETKSSTAPAIRRRFEEVLSGARLLKKQLDRLTLTDEMLYGLANRKRYLKGQHHTRLEDLSETIARTIPQIEESIERLGNAPGRGRMPAFAERMLAKSLCQLLFEETKTRPTAKKDGSFDRLLRLALSQAVPGKPRKDVADLMHHSLEHFEESKHLLPLFPGRST